MFGWKKIKEYEEENKSLRGQISYLEQQRETLQNNLMIMTERCRETDLRLTEVDKRCRFLEQDNNRLNKRVIELSGAEVRAKEANDLLLTSLIRFSDEICENITKRISVANFESSRRQITKTFQYCRSIISTFDSSHEIQWLEKLKHAHAAAVETDRLRQEQLVIKERMREEIKIERERQAEIARLKREEDLLKNELEKIMLRKKTEESEAKIAELNQLLSEAQQRSERAKSQAQLTRAGHVYIISNIGSFGEGVYKVGMTRRLEPIDRIRELGDASVPFPFDVHMMVSCDDAPKLELELHRFLHKKRINKVNLRKEFFKIDIELIRKFVEQRHGKVEYSAVPEALEFNETKLIDEQGFDIEFDESMEEDDEILDLNKTKDQTS